jgi:hypothetical protein
MPRARFNRASRAQHATLLAHAPVFGSLMRQRVAQRGRNALTSVRSDGATIADQPE